MAIQTIKMPDIGEGIAEVELVAWHIKVGDVVAEDQILADVMTDKATVEIPSHVAGTVVSLNAAVGEVVAVGTEIIHIEVSNDALALVDKAQAAIKDEAIKEEVTKAVATKAVAAPAPALPSKATRSPQTTAR